MICSISPYCFEIIEFHVVLKVESFGKEHVKCNQNHLGCSKQVIRQQTGMLFVNSLPAKAMPQPLIHKFLGQKITGVEAEEGINSRQKLRGVGERNGRLGSCRAGDVHSGGRVAVCVPLETEQGNSLADIGRLQYCVAHAEI